MKATITFLFLSVISLAAQDSPNILLICVDDLRPELRCYGVDYIESPAIDKLASEGILFQRHYVQAPTCGASRYAMLTGNYGPYSNEALFDRAEAIGRNPRSVSTSLPQWFREHGYETVSIGKISHHPGGNGGNNWDDPTILEMPLSWDRSHMPSGPWLHPKGAMHGLANGEIRRKANEMDVYQSFQGPDTSYPDGLIAEEAISELQRLSGEEKPFFLAVGFIRPHLPFGAPAKYMAPYMDAVLPPIVHPEKPRGKTTWHKSGEFMKYNRWQRDPNSDTEFSLEIRRHYAASVSYADAQVGRLLDKLKALNLDRNTIVVLWGDHGWHLGEHSVWGKHTLFEEALRSPLIIRDFNYFTPETRTDAIVESVDIFPTLCDLADIPQPEYIDGLSIVKQVNHSDTSRQDAFSYIGNSVTLRTATNRIIVHKDGYVELYDHSTPEKETLNIADNHPRLVSTLSRRLHDRSPEKLPAELLEKILLKCEQDAALNPDKPRE